jgi:release factor glutamine methyltransferase
VRRATELRDVSDTPRLDVELLLSHLLEKDRVFLLTWPEYELDAEQQIAFDEAMARRRRGEPVAHILGRREFWSLPLWVNASTLIPRPDTELLVETALNRLPQTAQRVLDLGTGTGAIALALASERPQWELTACDLSADAVALAERNRQHLGLTNLRIMQSDWFNQITPADFDAIVSNPPYISPADDHLAQGDLRYEPQTALVAAENGLADLRVIIERAAALNQRSFWLLLEHGWQQGEPVRQLMHSTGFCQVETLRDLAGHERVSLGWRSRIG